jgi:hypothetical protein
MPAYRATCKGLLTAVYHRDEKSGEIEFGPRRGQKYHSPAGDFAMVQESFSTYPQRVKLSVAQAAELSDPVNFGREVEFIGTLVKDGRSDVLEVATFTVGDHHVSVASK